MNERMKPRIRASERGEISLVVVVVPNRIHSCLADWRLDDLISLLEAPK